MGGPSGTRVGQFSDAILPPAVSLRLRARIRHGHYAAYAPPAVLSDLVAPGKVAVDVGAHRGLWSYVMSHRASAVHAFEPNPSVYAYLSRIRVRAVHAHQVALSDVGGNASLYLPDEWRSGRATIAHEQGESIATVETRTLDSYDLRDVGFLKVDVEGHEEAVLRGARHTLAAWHPTLLVEIEERHNPGAITRIPSTLKELGYAHAYFLSRGALAPMEDFDLKRHQLEVEGGADTASPEYANNFVFATTSLKKNSLD